MAKIAAILVALSGVGVATRAEDCSDLFDTGQILDFHITMAPADWAALRTSCPGGYCGTRPHFYWTATFRCEDGPEISVGIRRKNGKAEPSEEDPQKPALKIDINELVPEQTFGGKTKLNLENGGSSSGPDTGGGNGNGIREGFAWLLYNDAGIVASRVAWVRVWVNGEYKGLYTHVEQVDKPYLADHGIDDGGWLFKGPGSDQRTREGEPSPYAFNWYPFDHSNPADPQPPDWREQTEILVDLDQLFPLAAVTNFVANKDAVVFKNNNYWYYDWATFPEGRRRRLYLGWDLDTTMTGGDTDLPILGIPHNNGHIAQALLRDDPDFQARYFAAYAALLQGPLRLEATLARLDALQKVIGAALDGDPFQTAGNTEGQFADVRAFLETRTAFVQAALGACPDGVCQAGESPCTCPADCGAPPAVEAVCDDGIDQDCDGPVDCSDSDCDANPVCEGISGTENRIVITEVLATSPESPDVEFVEIHNEGPGVQDLTGWYLLDDDTQHDPCTLEGSLAPGEYLLVARSLEPFSLRFPEAIANLNPNPFDGEIEGVGFSLADGGDAVRLYRPGSPADVLVDGFRFGPQSDDVPFGRWPTNSDALEYLAFPTPGASNDLSSRFSAVCINEFLTTSSAGGIDDWIELYNRGALPVDLSGWSLSDVASNPTKYVFPVGTMIPAGGFVTVDEVDLGFALSSTGSEVIVLARDDGSVGQDYFDYGPQFADVSQGRVPDGASHWESLPTPSRGTANGCRIERLRWVGPADLVWDPGVLGWAYDLLRGDLATLRVTRGDFGSSGLTCLEDDSPVVVRLESELPSPGEGFFYLVRPETAACGRVTYDTASMFQTGLRDAEVTAAPGACP